MERIKKGDIVSRNSYGNDILFVVYQIVRGKNQRDIYLLKGLTMRIEADSNVEDLRLIENNVARKKEEQLEKRLEERASKVIGKRKKNLNKFKRMLDTRGEYVYTGKILHLDGDKRYTDKSSRYYKEMGLNAIVKNIPENKQPILVRGLLERYNPDILVITGHDAMLKNAKNIEDVSNYRNSKYFAKTVKQARLWDREGKLVIFAGACQSYFELLISSGANFASSPARVLIDFADPLIVAERVATTEKYKYITIEDIAYELRDGTKGVGGIGAKGKKEIIIK